MLGWFERRLDPFPQSRQSAPPARLFAFCWHYVREGGPWLFLLSLTTALIAIGEVALFGFLGQIVDWLSAADRTTFLDTEGPRLALMAGLVLIGLPAIVLIQTAILHQVFLGNLPMSTRWRMHKLLLGQSVSFFANEFAGRVATKVMQTALSVREAVIKLLDVFTYVFVYLVATVTMLAVLDLRLLVPLGVWFGIYLLILRYFIPRLEKVSEAQADARSVMTGRIVDSYTNIQTVKLFAHAGREEGYAKDSMAGFLATVHRQMRLVTAYQGFVYFNNCVLVFTIAALSIWLWLDHAITVGAIAIGVGLAMRLNSMSQWLMWELSALFENIGVVYDGMEMLAKPHTVVDKPDAKRLTVTAGAVSFEDMSFHYGKTGGIIEGLNLSLQPGENVGLVGRSGAGKTTLTNLLLRFYDVEAGRILIDGQDISEVTQDSLRASIGVVTQDTSLLHRSIRDNIAYGRPEASEAEITRAIKRAHADKFIADLTDQEGRTGLDAHVGERGVKLSGGQRQRIAIARIFLKDAPILILDEATSALDSEVEAAIQDNLFDLMSGKTVIAIAHRLSTIAAMDRLIVLDQGRIVEAGTHSELVAKGGLYADLWSRQSGGFLPDQAAKPLEAPSV